MKASHPEPRPPRSALSFTVQASLDIEVIDAGSVYVAACAALLLNPRIPVTDLKDLEDTLAAPSAAVCSLIQPEGLDADVPGIKCSRPQVWVVAEGAHMGS